MTEKGDPLVLTERGMTASERDAIYKASRRLAELGLVQLVTEKVEGHNRVVAYPATADAPPQKRIVGANGRVWRRPVTITRIPDPFVGAMHPDDETGSD